MYKWLMALIAIVVIADPGFSWLHVRGCGGSVGSLSLR
jgi:hypothetical protein